MNRFGYNQQSKEKIIDTVKSAQSIAIVSHISPDYDAILSCLLMRDVCEKFSSAPVQILINDSPPTWAKEYVPDNAILWNTALSTIQNQYDTLVFVDIDELSRADLELNSVRNQNSIRIDHHQAPMKMYTFDISSVNAGSTTTLLYEYFFKDIDLTKDQANWILTGILADTGFFRYLLDRSKETMAVAYEVLSKQFCDLGNIYAKLSSINEKDFEGFKIYIQNTINHSPFSQLAPITTTFMESNDAGIISDGGAYQQKVIRMIEGYEWGFLVHPYQVDGFYKISFRALHNPELPHVGELAKYLFEKGGGHVGAGGALLKKSTRNESAEQARDRVIGMIQKNETHIKNNLLQKFYV